jgi:hypothetical protein
MMTFADDGDEVDRWIARLVNPLRTLTPPEGLQIGAVVRRLLGRSPTTPTEPTE